jgi:hypothetical protein
LARSLGYPTRRALYAELTAADLIEWESLYSIDPWGPERSDMANGILCSLTDACHRTEGSAQRPLDYMPYVKQLREEPLSEEQSEEQMMAIWNNTAKAWNNE